MQDQHIEQSKRLWLKFALPLFVLVIGTLGAWALIQHKTAIDEAKVKKTPHEPPLVTVAIARREAQRMEIHSQGVVQPKIEIELVPEVSGKVIKAHLLFAPGGFIKKGEVLFQVDDRDYQFAVSRAEAAVAEAYKELMREREEAAQAQEEWQALGSGKASDYLLHKPQLKEREVKLTAAQADLAAAKLQVERCRLLAPFSGWIRDKRVLPGQYVTAGEKLARLYADDNAEIKLPIAPTDLAYLQLPESAKAAQHKQDVSLSTGLGGLAQHWQGWIVRVSSDVDNKNSLVYLIAEIPGAFKSLDKQIPLLPGTFVHAVIDGKERFDLVSLPKTALFGGNQVYSVDGAGQLKQHKVELLRNDNKRIIVSKGINDGDRIMIGGVDLPVAGMKVKINAPAKDKAL
jgi:membrane fusion protein, multidrug efflux system